MDIRDIFRLTQGYRKKEKHYMDKEFEDKGHYDLEDLNNIIFTDTDRGSGTGRGYYKQPGACSFMQHIRRRIRTAGFRPRPRRRAGRRLRASANRRRIHIPPP